ncbi:hypothetical protein EZ449_12245 [Pedobacter frigidisoli]|uniref:Uncharacterized protein n=1 Tax=Pedobacter frigidisoli TaxID=2530455 RepID=A0A4R0P6K2_9SPHI|nr:hypothetical protein [Pedobacter frigidisoli]TCD08603.1 hypothetical protein EZ449_12245 [Pedobacter frigidisoli]
MKQTEKLDDILRNAYAGYLDLKSMGYFGINELLAEAGVEVSFEENFALGKRLERERLVKLIGSKDSVSIKLTSNGLEYCESESQPSIPLIQITNNHITNSPQANLISGFTGITITQDDTIKGFTEALKKIESQVTGSGSIAEATKVLALERVDKIIGYTEARNEIPKRGLTDLIGMAGDLSSVASLILSLKSFISGL